MLLVRSDQVRHRFRPIFASTKTTHSLTATQEAQSHVDFQAIGLEAFVKFAIAASGSPALPRQLTPESAPFTSFGFHTYLTADSGWIADGQLPGSRDKCPMRRRGQKSLWRGWKRRPAGFYRAVTSRTGKEGL
jgi:hypothetical protein